MIEQTAINGYILDEEVASNHCCRIFYGRRCEDEQSVVIKLGTIPDMGLEILKEFYYSKIATSPYFLEVMEVIDVKGHKAIVYRRSGEESLRYKSKGKAPDLETFLLWAIDTAKALDEIHRAGFFLKTLSTESIFIHPETKLVRFINVYHPVNADLDKIADHEIKPYCDLSYISPEQTVRIRHQVDCRSDYYSFGVVCYELLTGQPPFHTTNLFEALRRHAASRPLAPAELNRAPKMVSDIVMKLLERRPEDRYQSLTGLIDDLAYCLEMFRADGDITIFPMAVRDARDQFYISQQLYERQDSINTIQKALAQTMQGEKTMVFIEGSDGLGKSALIANLYTKAVEHNLLFTHGGCDPVPQKHPYQPFARAFDALLLSWMAQTDQKEIERYRLKIKEALGDNIGVLAGVIPSWTEFFGEGPALPKLDGFNQIRRFYAIWIQLFRILASLEVGFICVIEDIDYIDPASARLLTSLIEEIDMPQIMLLVTFHHWPERFMIFPSEGDSQKNQAMVLYGRDTLKLDHIILKPLSLATVRQWTADSFSLSRQQLSKFASICYQKTQGNPRETSAFFRQLYRDGVLHFNLETNQWEADTVKLETIELEKKTPEDKMRARLDDFSEDAREMLYLAACLGARFSTKLLEGMTQLDAKSIFERLAPAIFKGILSPIRKDRWLSGNYRFNQTTDVYWIMMVMPPEKRAEVHGLITLELGMLSRRPSLKLAWHAMNAGGKYAIDEAEIFARYCLEGAYQGVEIGAFCRSLRLLTDAIERMTEMGWQTHRQLMWDLHLQAYECSFLSDVVDETRRYHNLLLEKTQTESEYFTVLSYYFSELLRSNQFHQVIDIAMDELERLGLLSRAVTIDSSLWVPIWQAGVDKIEQDGLAQLLAKPVSKDNLAAEKMMLFSRLCYCFYAVEHPMIPYCVSVAFDFSMRTGMLPGIDSILLEFAMLCAWRKRQDIASQVFQFGLQLPDRYQVPKSRLMAFSLFFSDHWFQHLQQPDVFLPKIERLAIQEGNPLGLMVAYATATMTGLGLSFPIGYLIQLVTKALSVGRNAFYPLTNQYLLLFRQYCLALSGKTEHIASLDDSHFSSEDFKKNLSSLGNRVSDVCMIVYGILQTSLLFIADQYQEAFTSGEKLKKRIDHMGPVWLKAEFYFVYGLTAARLMGEEGTEDQKSNYVRVLNESIAYFEYLIPQCEENFKPRWFVLKAASSFGDISLEAAFDIWQKAMSVCQQNNCNKEAGALQAFFGNFLVQKGFSLYGIPHIIGAIESYRQWQAAPKARMLTKRFRRLIMQKDTPLPQSLARILDTTITETLLNMLSSSIFETNPSVAEKNLCRIWGHCASADLALWVRYVEGQLVFNQYFTTGDDNYDDTLCKPINRLDYHHFPRHLVEMVARIRRPVSWPFAAIEIPTDAYIFQANPASAIAVPVIANQTMVGVMYLENKTEKDLYNDKRVYFLEKLATMVAFLIGNAEKNYQAQQGTIDLEERFKERSAALNVLVTGIAHEVNTPIGNALTAASHIETEMGHVKQSVLEGKLTKNRLTEAIDMTLQGIDITISNLRRSAELVRTFKQVSVEQTKEEKIQFDLVEYIYSLVDHLEPLLSKKPIQIKYNMPPRLIVHSYPQAYSQVFSSLFVNTMMHAFETREQGTIWIDMESQGSLLLISFKDDGIGMSPEIRAKIFDPFSTTKRGQGGSGLGAHIMYNLITQRLAGQIKCHSELGKGTEFMVKVPIESP